MCLDTVTRIIKVTKPRRYYKVFGEDAGELRGDLRAGRYKAKKWYRGKNGNYTDNRPLETVKGAQYPAGFHAWRTLKGAKAWALSFQVVYEVELRGALTFGWQRASFRAVHPAVCGSEMRIIRRVE